MKIDKREIMVKLTYPLDRMFHIRMMNEIYFWYARRRLGLSPLPLILKIEPTNRCNGACIFCPHDKMTRPKGNMSQKLFEKIISEATGNGIFEVEFVHMGETLLDPNIFEKVKMAKSKGMRTQAVTNGSLFSSKKIIEMCDSGLDILKVSFEGYSEEIFKKLRPKLDFQNISDNIRAIMRYKREKGLSKPFVIVRSIKFPEYDKEMEDFILNWSQTVDDIEILPLHNWTNQTNFEAKVPLTCLYPWTHMTILQDGRVVPCSVEWEGNGAVGDLNSQSLVEVWQGPEMKRIRRKILTKKMQDIAICRHCDIPYSENRLNFLNQLVALHKYPDLTVLRKD